MLNRFLFKHIDNSALIIFRIIFGLLCFLESVGAIFTGWVKITMISPQHTFSFMDFEWLQPLPGYWMYAYYVLMGVFGLFIMLGYRYRFSALAFTVLWAGTYFMQKSSYNNHYYLLMLLSGLMIFQPANKYLSLDIKRNPSIVSYSMPRWSAWIFILQMFIVYTYGSINKIYPDWLNLNVMKVLMQGKKHYVLVGNLLQETWLQYFLAYGGILFDGLVIPLLLIKKTRKLAFFASVFFHLFNSFIFQVGIFPYLSLAFCLFFFSQETIHKLFLKRKPFYDQGEVIVPKKAPIFKTLFITYFVIQLLLPVRHYFIKGEVFWTEEGHRMSWRMMLRAKHGLATYIVVDKNSGKQDTIRLENYLTPKQIRSASTKPDVIWQFAQRLKNIYSEKGQDVSVFVKSRVSLNGGKYKPLIDPTIDLTTVPWEPFKHSDWILPEN